MVTAAWALRKVAAKETIPAIIDKARRQTEQRKNEVQPGVDDQVAHLFEACGLLKATDVAPLLIQYIPKVHIMGERSRSAAIWSIGRLMEGVRQQKVEDALIDRISDFAPRNPESPLVKQMCLVALARMKAVDRAPELRDLTATGVFPVKVALAIRWAVKELTGEELPPPQPRPADQGRWFLEPVP
jgi:hypothetical protein